MAESILIARIASIVFLCVGLAGLIDKKRYVNIVRDMFSNSGLALVYGFIELLISFLVVSYHNVWQGWPMIITVVAWMGVIEGAWIIVFPKKARDFSVKYFKGAMGKAMPYIAFAIGLVFGYLGFFM